MLFFSACGVIIIFYQLEKHIGPNNNVFQWKLGGKFEPGFVLCIKSSKLCVRSCNIKPKSHLTSFKEASTALPVKSHVRPDFDFYSVIP